MLFRICIFQSLTAVSLLLAGVEVPNAGGWGSRKEFSVPIADPGISGDLYLVFARPGGGLLDLDWVRFDK
jgi:hypothetical protein